MDHKQHVVNLRQFTWVKTEGLLVAEASDFQWAVAPQGFIIESPSGQTRRFAYRKAVKDREGEVTHWEYRPVQAACRVRKVVVVND